MRPTICIFVSFFFFANVGSSYAADPQQLFGAILGEIQGQIQRKQQRRIRKRLRPLWQACAKGDVDACDAAATYQLNTQSRANLVRLRDLAVRRPQFERDWHACQNKDVAACRAALNYPALNEQGRRTLRAWRRRAIDAEGQAAKRRAYIDLRYDCLANNTLRACVKALGYAGIDAEERGKLTARRQQILYQQEATQEKRHQQAKKREQYRLRTSCFERHNMSACSDLLAGSSLSYQERSKIDELRKQLISKQQRQRANEAARAAFQALAQKCFDGQLYGCRDAISHRGATSTDRSRLIAKRDQILAQNEAREHRLARQRKVQRLQAACLQRDQLEHCREVLTSSTLSEQDRAVVVRQFSELVIRQQRRATAKAARKAEQQRFDKLRSECLTGNIKAACVAAAEHHLASQPERTKFERKRYELLSLPEQLMSTFVKATGSEDWKPPGDLAPHLIFGLGMAGAAFLICYAIMIFNRKRATQPSRQPEIPAEEPVLTTPFAKSFPLTGHLPTDVRQVLHGS